MANRRRPWAKSLLAISYKLLAAELAGMCFAQGGAGMAGNNSSLSDLDIEFTEAQVTLQTVTQENALLRQQLRLAQAQVASLTESMAIANSEAEVFKRQTSDLKLRMEALGLDAANPDRAKLEQRLLKAVSDLKIVEAEKNKLADQLVRLSEAVVRYLKSASSTDGDARMGIEAEMRATSEALGMPSNSQALAATAVPATLTDSMVISVKEEYALVIANVGREHGVKIGMPFQVWRGEERIGSVRVVDVRDKISGAVIQDLNGTRAKIKVGDRLRVDAQL
ncbi:MAG TPA: hypothetical protein VKA97_11340 [Pyrinomonadaceae bacterium]|nr:hypothetical protein [Pyrinomonadaceae bacterium]